MHHRVVLCHGFVRVETLIEDKMVIALERVAVDDRVGVMVLLEQFAQVRRSLSQMLDGESDVLYQAGGADGTRAAHCGEDTRTHRPIFAHQCGVLGKPGGLAEGVMGQHLFYLTYLVLQFGLRRSLHFQQFRSGIFGQTLQFRKILLYDAHGTPVEILHCRWCAGLLQFRHAAAGRLGGREQQQRRSRVAVVLAGLHHDRRQERQRAFRAHDEVSDDVEGILVLHKRQDSQTRHVLNTVFLANQFRQAFVGQCAVTQVLDAAHKMRVRHTKIRLGFLVTGVQNSAVGQNQSNRIQHPIGVGMYATHHTRGVVVHDTAYHRRVKRSRIGRETAAVGLQDLIYPCAHDARLQTNTFAVVQHLVLLPFLARHHQNRRPASLSRQRRTRSTESDRLMLT